MIYIDDRTYLYWVLLLLLLPLKWLITGFIAAVFHELCHMAAVCLAGGRVTGLRIRPLGIVMNVEGIRGFREALCALAGPAGSLVLVLFIRPFPMLGLCGLIQGVFNLIPVYPMDGGRILHVIMRKRP